MGLFVSIEPVVLVAALDKITREAERMPTPGMLTKAIAAVRLEKGINAPQVGERNCTCKKCHGTGFEIFADKTQYTSGANYQFAKKCHCHEQHALNTGCIEAVDPSGTMCWMDSRTGQYEYRAIDCPEGKKFLSFLARVANKMDLNKWYEDGMQGNRPA